MKLDRVICRQLAFDALDYTQPEVVLKYRKERLAHYVETGEIQPLDPLVLNAGIQEPRFDRFCNWFAKRSTFWMICALSLIALTGYVLIMAFVAP